MCASIKTKFVSYTRTRVANIFRC